MMRLIIAVGFLASLSAGFIKIAHEDALAMASAVRSDLDAIAKIQGELPERSCRQPADAIERFVQATSTKVGIVAAAAITRGSFQAGCLDRAVALTQMSQLKRVHITRSDAERDEAWAMYGLIWIGGMFGQGPVVVDAVELGAFELERRARRDRTEDARPQG